MDCGGDRLDSVRAMRARRAGVLTRDIGAVCRPSERRTPVLDVVFVLGILALVALVALVGKAVERL